MLKHGVINGKEKSLPFIYLVTARGSIISSFRFFGVAKKSFEISRPLKLTRKTHCDWLESFQLKNLIGETFRLFNRSCNVV